MTYRYRNRKIKIIIDILEFDVLVKADDKYGTLLSSISENKEDFEEDINDLIEVCPNKTVRKWVRNIDWDTVNRVRYCMKTTEYTLSMFTRKIKKK